MHGLHLTRSVLFFCLASQFIFISKLCFLPEEERKYHSIGNRNPVIACLLYYCQVSLLPSLPNEREWKQTLLLSWLLLGSKWMPAYVKRLSLQFLFGCVCKASLGAGGGSAMARQPRHECSLVQECLLWEPFPVFLFLDCIAKTEENWIIWKFHFKGIYYTLLPPHLWRYKDTKLPFPFNIYGILWKSFLAAIHRKVHPLEQSSTLEVTALGQKSRIFPWMNGVLYPDNDMHNCVRRGWEHSCALRSSEGTWGAGAAVHGLFYRSSGNQMVRSKQSQQNSTAQP